STRPPAFSKSARSAEIRSLVRRRCVLPSATSRVVLRMRALGFCLGLAMPTDCSGEDAREPHAMWKRAVVPAARRGVGLPDRARAGVSGALFVAKHQRDPAQHLLAVGRAFVAAVRAAHRELAADGGALFVDRAAHAR